MPLTKDAIRLLEDRTTQEDFPIAMSDNTGGTTTDTSTIYKALAAAQAEIGNVTKNAENSFFKNAKGKASKFVDLAALTEAVIPVLSKHGLFLNQRLDLIQYTAGGNPTPVLITQIFHESGQFIPASVYPIVTKDANDPQKFGAGVTYARRYAVMAYLSIAAEDDDGNLAATPTPKPNPTRELADLLKAKGINNKEKLAEWMEERYNKKDATLASLTPDQVREAISDVKNTPDF